MVKILQKIEHNSGIPLGGIGTGTVEVRPDGLFHEWHMFNVGQWNSGLKNCCGGGEAMNPEDLLFLVRTRTADGAVTVRYLALREQIHDLYCLPWARSVEAIDFEGTFPLATLEYVDSGLPVKVTAEVFAPFVPLESQASGTPGFYVHFSVKNLTDKPVEASILGIMKNAAGYDQAGRVPHNKLHEIDGGVAVELAADGLAPDNCSTGDMTFAAMGGELSYVSGAFKEDRMGFTMYKSRYGMKVQNFMHQFFDDGELHNLDAETRPELPEAVKASELSQEEREQILGELLRHPWFYDKYQRFSKIDLELADSPEFFDELVGNLAEINERKIPWGLAALCSKMQLAPEAEDAALFSVAWFFPNHISPTGANLGHMYEHWFGGSLDVAQFMLENYAELRDSTLALPEAIHDSSLPAEAADAIASQLTTMTKCTWWTKAGDFGVWEGYGCCGFHTTDITYQGSFPIIALFPDLQKKQMEAGAEFQREDGRVHHFFTPDFSAVDNGFDRVDMNQQFVMLAARDYLWSGDKDYLQRLWPHILRAMDNTAELDTDGDGLPDTDTRRNTYDVWDFRGCPSYISSLWLGALKAAIRLANEMGDKDRAAKWQAEYDKGVRSFDEKLWNGEYYMLWRDGDQVDECCMSDQMSGDWFTTVSGWGTVLEPARVRQALEAIMRHNFQPNIGLLNATYPEGKERRTATSGNYQADAAWTGIEYTVAALLIEMGMVSEGMAVVRDIHSRYLQAGRFWNQVECGGHYYRAMSSWTVLLALSGFAWDEPQGKLTFAPAIPEPSAEYPFFTPLAWGTYYQDNGLTGKLINIELNAGEMRVAELCLPKLSGFEEPTVLLGETEVEAAVSPCGDGVCIKFRRPITITPEKALIVTA